MTTPLLLRVKVGADSLSELSSPTVGIFAASVSVGEMVSAGRVLGTVSVLGVSQTLRAPESLLGRVSAVIGGGRARVPVQYGDVLIRVSTEREVAGSAGGLAADTEHRGDRAAFVAPMSGRFYTRPAPDEPPFVSAGDTVCTGQTIGLLEVMKTFNRLAYEGADLPATAVVESIAPADGDDVARGDVILVLQSESDD